MFEKTFLILIFYSFLSGSFVSDTPETKIFCHFCIKIQILIIQHGPLNSI